MTAELTDEGKRLMVQALDAPLGVAEIADLTGLLPGTITKYRARGIFPPPDWTTARQDLWRYSTIATWMADRRKETKQ